MNVTPLTEADHAEITALLDASQLPTSDLPQARPTFLGLRDERGLIGVVGVERLGRVGLLRSLAVREDQRGSGLGTRLADAAEHWAVAAGIEELYLLTTTAEQFFARRAYTIQARDQVHSEIRATTEFCGACPASAVVMRRVLGR